MLAVNNLKDVGKKETKVVMNVLMTMNMLPIEAVYQNVEYFTEIKIAAVLINAIKVANSQLDVGKVTNSGVINVLTDMSMLQTEAVNLKLPVISVAKNQKDVKKKVLKDAIVAPMTMNMLPVKVVYQNVVYFIEMKMVAVLVVVIQAVINQLAVGVETNSDAINVLMDFNM